MKDRIEIIDELIMMWLSNIESLNKESFHKIKNKIYSKYKIEKPFASIEIIDRYNDLIKLSLIKENSVFRKVLRKRGVRSLSWLSVISLLTKSFWCPWKCIYCPTFEWLPKSYIPNEPAVQRAELNKFDPILQIHNRLRALEITWHKIEKNDVRIIWWTWSFYPKEYKDSFIKGIYDAFNNYDDMKYYIESTDLSSDKFAIFKIKESYKMKVSLTLSDAKKLNETSKCRVVWIAIETRPDWINKEEIKSLREYWITRVEIGYQTTIDEINILNKRGHTNKESINATKLLKDAWFKVVAHIMPNLLSSNPELDKKSLKEVFDNPDFRPDELKIYPMMVTKNSELTKIWENGLFKAYDDETLINLIAELEAMIPEYVRLNRTYRDIPSDEILEWSKIANLRQIVEFKLKNDWVKLLDIRHREIKDWKNDPHKAILNIYEYKASKWIEFFLSYEDKDDRTIFSLLRLRLPKENIEILEVFPELNGASLIRELHTFWDQLFIWEKGSIFGQHIWFWKKLLEEAEKISKNNSFNKIAVISWEWVKEYYKNKWYLDFWNYMIKNI